MALAPALHHSAGPRVKVEMQQNGAPRGQKTAASAGEEVEHATHYGPRAQETPPGVRPGSLAEPGPQRSDRSLRRSSGQTPLLGVPSLADAPAEAIDGRTLRYLLKANIARGKFEEEEEEEKKYQERSAETRRRAQALLDHAASLPKRKRKKRRKKKTPRSSSHPSLRRAHRRHWQWYVLAGFPGYDTPRAVFPSIVDVRGDSTGAVLGQGDMPVVVPSGAFGQTVQKTAYSPQLQSIAGRQHPLRAANADLHGPVCTADHGDSTVAAYFGGRCSCWRVVQILRCCSGEALGAPTVAARREICDFLRPLVSDSHLFGVRVCLWSTRVWIFWEMTPGMISVLNTPQFHSGYIFGVSLRSLLD